VLPIARVDEAAHDCVAFEAGAARDGALEQDVIEAPAVEKNRKVRIHRAVREPAGQDVILVDEDLGRLDAAIGLDQHLVGAP